MSLGPTLETERLILRPPQREDFDAWAELSADTETMVFLGGVQPRALAWRHFLSIVGGWHVQGFAPFSVLEKASSRWIGRLGPLMPEGWPGTEIGWTIARSDWGRGYAVEASIAATDWAFANLGWTEVIHCISPDNRASQVVAGKLGSRNLRPGQMPAPYEDIRMDIWGQSRDHWYGAAATRMGK